MPRGIYIRTKKTRENLSKAQLGKIPWNKGLKTGYNKKQADKIRGRKHSEKTKRKMKKSQKERFKNPKNHFHRFGKENNSWKGGRTKRQGGYIYIYSAGHPFANKKGAPYIFEHRLVVEAQIGRYLTPKERVHHLGKKDDNRPQMLMAFVNINAHHRFERGKPVKPEEIIFDGRKLVTTTERR